MTNKRKSPIFDHVPPHDEHMEMAVLGGIIIESHKIDFVSDLLTPDHFYIPHHQHIFTAILNLHRQSHPVDILTVVNELREIGKLDDVGGPIAVANIGNAVASASNIEYHCRILAEMKIKRDLITTGQRSIQIGFDDQSDAFDGINEVETMLFQSKNGALKRNAQSSGRIVQKTLDQIHAVMTGGEIGIPCGLQSITQFIRGWKPSDLIIVAARPGMGKTVMGMTACTIAVQHNIPVAMFSLEMSSEQLMSRMISMIGAINNFRIQSGNLHDGEFDEIVSIGKRIASAPFYIDDTAALNVFDFRSKVRRLVMQYGIKLVVVDYLQLMTTGIKGQIREQEISTISRTLKQVAKEMNIPVIALAQLSRDIEKRGGRAKLSDLRESGSIEQDSDMVIFLDREPLTDMNGEPDTSSPHPAMLDIKKHRNGPLGTIRMTYEPKFVRFTDNP